jgi:multiple sugar transport system substrate-binding protein
MRSFSRRSFVSGSVAALAVVALAACGSSAQPTATSAPTRSVGTAPAAGATPTAGAAASAVGGTTTAGGVSTPSAAGQATPAASAAGASSFKGATLTFIGGTYFVSAAQDLFTKQLQQWGGDNGVKTSADYMNWPDLQAKIAAAVQAGAGADMAELWPVWPFLYQNALADVSDVASAFEKAQGGFYDWVTTSVQVNGKWLGVPTGATNDVFNYRISYFKQAGYEKFPDTWDDLFAAGKKLKAMGKPLGQALGHSLGDPPGFAYPYMWSYGAMEVEKDGKTVAFNKPQFVDGMKKFIQAWKDAFDETGLSWDDSNNNRAFLADQISGTLNGTSIYESAKKDNPKIAEDMDHADIPQGPAGRFYNLGSHSFAILKSSKGVDAAKAFYQWWFDQKQFGDWLHIQNTYQLPPTKTWEKDPMWTKDPKLAAVGREPQFGRTQGYAGPANEKSALAMSKYIVVDTFAKAVQSSDAQGSIDWGAEQLRQIYGG